MTVPSFLGGSLAKPGQRKLEVCFTSRRWSAWLHASVCSMTWCLSLMQMHMAGCCISPHAAKTLNLGPGKVCRDLFACWVLSYSALDSPIKGGHLSNSASSASQFNFFSEYPGSAPKVQLRSSASPSKAQFSQASKLYKPILDFQDNGTPSC